MQLSISTSVWAKPPLHFQDSYKAALEQHLHASTHALVGPQPVNEWVRRAQASTGLGSKGASA